MTPRQRILHHLRGSPLVRAADLMALPGVNRRAIQNAALAGAVDRPATGIYAAPGVMAEADPTDLSHAVGCLLTGGVVCGASAAVWHDLTDDSPSYLHMLVQRTYTHPPQGMPLQLVRSGLAASFKHGVDERRVLGVTVRITNAARTVIDLYRLGSPRQFELDALRTYLASGGSIPALRGFSRPFDRRHCAGLDRLWADAEVTLNTLENIRP